MELLLANIPFILVLVLLIIRVISAVKNGAVKEICSLISAVVSSVFVLLIAFAIREYFHEARIIFVITIILLVLLLVVYKILQLALTTMKIIAKLPVVGFINKLLGIVIGAVEVVFVVCAVFSLVKVMDLGAIERWMMNCKDANPIMEQIYNLNETTVYPVVASIGDRLRRLDLFGKLGM